MAYRKPGVEIKQEQRSSTPILPSPELESCIIGQGYYWQDPNWENESDPDLNSIHSVKYTGAELTINTSDINSKYNSVIDETVVVDLLGTKGAITGDVFHLKNGTDFTVLNDIITITADLVGLTALGDEGEAQVKVGFLATNASIEGELKKLNSLNDVRDIIGEPVSWNPLAFGASLAMENSGASTYVYGLGSSFTHADAHQKLSLKEVYSIGVLDDDPGVAAYNTHVTNLSQPENKKERIVFVNEQYTYTSDLDADSEGIRDRNSAYNSKRLFSIHPYSAYVVETRHVSTLRSSFISAVFDTSEVTNYRPKFISDVTINGIKYKSGSDITEAILDDIIEYDFAGSDGLMTVLAPVPGYYFAAIAAGQVAGKLPQNPLTNVPTSGLDRTIGSQDMFSESQLNVMASGGTYIMTQTAEQSPIVSRHHVSTNITSVAKRELSVTTALDYTAKFFRNALNPYIGRFNITNAFLKLVNSIVVSGALFLTRDGIVEDIDGVSVTVDETNPDTILIEMNVKVKFPVNYIKITLIF